MPWAHPPQLIRQMCPLHCFSTSQYSATAAPLDAASSLPTAARLSTIVARKTKRKQGEVQCPTCSEKCLVDFTDKDAEDLPATSGNNLDAVRSYVGEQSKGVLEADVLGREMLRQIPLGQSVGIYFVSHQCIDGAWRCGEEAWAKFEFLLRLCQRRLRQNPKFHKRLLGSAMSACR